jgi:hypothetical protein
MNKFVTGTAMASLLSTASVSAVPDQPCFSGQEMEDILLVLAPMALKTMSDQCVNALPNGAVLGNQDSAIARKLDKESKDAWKRAFPAILRVMLAQSGEKPPLGVAPPTQAEFSARISPMLGKIIKRPESCAPANEILKLAEPLPTRNLAGMLVQIMHMQPKGKEIAVLCPVN